jgi:hypothetical protein
MPQQPPNPFVADGQQRIRATPEYWQKVQEIQARIWARYADEPAGASLWQRWGLHWKIRREIRRACADLAPDEALYLHR